MKKTTLNLRFLLFVGLILILSIWGPETLSRYMDHSILDETHTETVNTSGEGYLYALSGNERLYIVSKCLNSQTLPETEQNALTNHEAADVDYQSLEGTYAFVVNHRGPSEKEISDTEIFDTCNRGVEALKELGILPEDIRKVDASSYDAVLYSAIDVLEPRNNVTVWKMSLSNIQKNANKADRLIDAYIDADSGKIYEFYARTSLVWEDVNPDKIIEEWSEYMGLSSPMPYEAINPLLETTPYFKKYMFTGMGGENTIVTIGFYEGINEIFLKISR